MKFTLNWLKEYVDINITPEELSDVLTMADLEVEEYFVEKRDFDGIIVAKVVSVEKHPDADKLSLCQVSTGNEEIQIVCGAPNVRAGMVAPLATVGGRIGEIKITARKLRGVESNGMLCSEAELGLSENADGLMDLPQDWEIGADINKYLGEPDVIFDVAILPNRADCLSVIGVARQVSAATGAPFKKPDIKVDAESGDISKYMSVEINNPEKCYRYSGRYLENVTIKPSPMWMVQRLNNVGMRSINNVVDITNYVMLETGQPLHAFDYDFVAGHKIIVKTAKDGEKFITLDDKERDLDADALMICDAEKPVALGGVMGGQNSEVQDSTTKVFLESAHFEPTNIRLTSKKRDMLTESSRRFERGVDPNGTIYAMNRAAQLMVEYADAQVIGDEIDVYPTVVKPHELTLTTEYTNRLLGTDFLAKDLAEFFPPLGVQVLEVAEKSLRLEIPTFRFDLEREVDLIEEVAILHGYNEIEPNLTPVINQLQTANPRTAFRDDVRKSLTGLGFYENISVSMVSEKLAQPFVPEGYDTVKLLNPLSQDMAIFRPNLLQTVLTNISYNKNRQHPNLMYFEIGNAALSKGEKYNEWTQIACVIAGNQQDQSWYAPAESVDFYFVKGLVQEFLNNCGIDNFEQNNVDDSYWDVQSSTIEVNGTVLGAFGKISDKVCSLYKIKSNDVFAITIDFSALYELKSKLQAFQPFSKFPSVPFDLAILIDSNISLADVENEIKSAGGELLTDVKLFDYYKGERIDNDKKSFAFSLTFSSMEKTLEDDTVSAKVDEILKSVNTKFGATLRPN